MTKLITNDQRRDLTEPRSSESGTFGVSVKPLVLEHSRLLQRISKAADLQSMRFQAGNILVRAYSHSVKDIRWALDCTTYLEGIILSLLKSSESHME